MATERFSFTAGRYPVDIVASSSELLISKRGTRHKVSLAELTDFYVASNTTAAELIIRWKAGSRHRVIRLPSRLDQPGLRDSVTWLLNTRPHASRLATRRTKAFRMLKVRDTRSWKWLGLVMVATLLAVGMNYSKFEILLDRGEEEVSVANIVPGWQPRSRNLVIHDVRVAKDLLLEYTERSRRSAETTWYVPVVPTSWFSGEEIFAVFQLASKDEFSHLEASTVKAFIPSLTQSPLPSQVSKFLKERIPNAKRPIMLTVPPPTESERASNALFLPMIVFLAGLFLVLLFRWRWTRFDPTSLGASP